MDKAMWMWAHWHWGSMEALKVPHPNTMNCSCKPAEVVWWWWWERIEQITCKDMDLATFFASIPLYRMGSHPLSLSLCAIWNCAALLQSHMHQHTSPVRLASRTHSTYYTHWFRQHWATTLKNTWLLLILFFSVYNNNTYINTCE